MNVLLSLELLVALCLFCCLIPKKYNKLASVGISLSVLAVYIGVEFVLLLSLCGLAILARNTSISRFWLAIAFLLFVEKLAILLFGDQFKVSGLSFFLITLAVLISKRLAANDVVALSLFFPHVLAGPIIYGQQDLSISRTERIGSGLVLYSFGRILLFCSEILQARFTTGLADMQLNLFLDGLLYLMTLFSNFFGYSLVALAYAWLMGINIPLNFNAPGLATGSSEFWSRWHISLSYFMKEYLFRWLRQKFPVQVAVAATLIISGFWHGLGFGFLIWSIYFVAVALLFPRVIEGGRWSSILRACVFFVLTLPSWVFFGVGSTSLSQLVSYEITFENSLAHIGVKAMLVLSFVSVVYFIPIRRLLAPFGRVRLLEQRGLLFIEMRPWSRILWLIFLGTGLIFSEGLGLNAEFIYEAF